MRMVQSGSEHSNTILADILSQAERSPNHPAISVNGTATSYHELVITIRRFAARFAEIPRPCVMIVMPRCADAYTAMLGALLCGGYYVPVNNDTPEANLRYITSTIKPDFIISQPEVAQARSSSEFNPVHIDPSELPATLYSGYAEPNRIAYIMFTSGSTGIPKGVVIPRIGLDNYVAWIKSELGLSSADRISQNSNIGFDLSVLEVYGCLCNGGTLVPASNRMDRLMAAELIRREALTVWISVPSSISIMMGAGHVTPFYLNSVRLFVHCGETLLPEHLQAVFGARPEAVVYNLHGPTEATVSMTANRLTVGNYLEECGTSVALGSPIQQMDVLLVGTKPDEGEIVIIGPQVALGYLNDPARTDHAFRAVAVGESLKTGYFTGDWAERRGGRLFFKQRFDRQIKVRGFPIELDEIEAAVRGLGWTSCSVFKWGNMLAAVVEKRAGLDVRLIRRQLVGLLEDYKIPSIFEEIETMPYNENDKLDTAGIAKWFTEVRAVKRCAVPGIDAVERMGARGFEPQQRFPPVASNPRVTSAASPRCGTT